MVPRMSEKRKDEKPILTSPDGKKRRFSQSEPATAAPQPAIKTEPSKVGGLNLEDLKKKLEAARAKVQATQQSVSILFPA